jgi:hypothetical protein
LDVLWDLWRERRPAVLQVGSRVARKPAPPDPRALHDVARWETALGRLVLDRDAVPGGTPADGMPGLADDPGIAIFRQLVREFRSGRIARALRYTVLALLRGLGPARTNALMQAYCRSCPSDLFTAAEAEHFATYVQRLVDDRRLELPLIGEVLAFERAMLHASMHGQGSALRWSVDPVALFEALEHGTPLSELPRVESEMVVGA